MRNDVPFRKVCRVFAMILAMIYVFTAGALADTLALPSALKVIDAEAFYGDTSLDEVTLPDRIEEIRDRAFAGSSVRKINLPDSLRLIADDAFSGTSIEELMVEAGDTYAYRWAYDHDYAPPVITAQPVSVFSGLDETAVFSLTAIVSEADYDWQYSDDGEEWTSAGVNTPSYAFTVTMENKDRRYRCVVSHGTKSVISDIVRVENALPTELSLSETGILTFRITETKPHTVMLGVYGSQPAHTSFFPLIPKAFAEGDDLLAVIPVMIGANETEYSINISNFFTSTGDYRVEAKAVGSAEEKDARDMGVGSVVSSNTVYFTRPDTSLETPAGISWGTGMAYGRAYWNEVADAASYQVMLYSGNDIVASRNINTTYFDFSSGWVDFANVTAGQYTFTVTALSADITQVSNSAESAHSALLAEPDQSSAVSIVTQPASRYAAQGSEASISVAVNGIGVTCQWFVDEEAVGLEDDFSIDLDTSVLGTQDVYCVVTDAFGNTERSATATVTVLDDRPVEHIISAQPQDAEVDPDGHAVIFTVGHSLPSYYRIEYTWYYSYDEGADWEVFGGNRSRVSCDAYPSNNGLRIRCSVKATSPTGAVICEEMSETAALTVRKKDIAITTDLDSYYWTAGERYAFIGAEADESLNAQLTYQWYVDGQPWPGATMNMFDLSLITEDSEIYCVLTAGTAAETSRTATVHVGTNPATEVRIIVQSGNTEHLAAGDSVRLRAALSPAKCTSAVEWSSDEPGVAAVDQYGHVTAVGFGEAVITASAEGCSDWVTVHVDSYKVTYDPMGGRFPDGETSSRLERVAIGQNASLPQVFKQGDTFRGWELNGEIVTSLIPASDVTLYAAWENSVQQEDDDVEIAQDMEPRQYAKIGEYAKFEVVTNGAKVRSYEWQVSTDEGGTWSRYDDGVADGRKTSLEVLAAAENNGWQFRVVITGYRNGTVVTSTASTLATGTTDTPPQTESFRFTLQPVDAVCGEGETVSFTVSVNADDAVYQWQKDGQDIPGAAEAVYTISAAELEDAGSYACVVTAGGSTKRSEGAALTVNQTLIHITRQPEGKEIAEGADETLSIVATPVGVTYAWEEASASGDEWEQLGAGSELSLSWLPAGTHTIRAVVSKEGFASVISNEVTVAVQMARYTVTYDANQGHFESDNGSTVTVSGVRGTYTIDVEIPVREGYEFTGWMIGDEPVEGDTITVNGDVTLLAGWREIRYTVTYDAGLGFFENDQRTMTVENVKGTYALIDDEPAREGYSFGGWMLNGQIVTGTIEVTEDITLQAEWAENPSPDITQDLAPDYYPSIDGQGFRVDAEGIDLHYQWQTKMPGGDWTDVPDNDSNLYTPFLNASHDGMQIRCVITDEGYAPPTTTNSATATFHWVIHATSVRIEEVDVPNNPVIGDQLTLRAVVEPEGYTDQIIWTSDHTDIATVSDGTVTINGLGEADISASANGMAASYHLTVNHVVVTLNANGGAFSDGSETILKRAEVGAYVPSDEPAKKGFSFMGWSETEDGQVISELNITESVTLYAVWEEESAGELTIQTQPAHVLAKYNGSVTFAVEAGLQKNGSLLIPEGISYQWQKYSQSEGTWGDIPGATGDSYTVSGVKDSDNRAKYRVIVSYQSDTLFSDEAVLFVLNGSSYSETMIVQVGEVVNLYNYVSGYPRPTIEIYEEGPNYQTPVSHGSDYTFIADAEQDGHGFFCQVTLDDVSVQTQTMTLSVQQPSLTPYSVIITAGQEEYEIDPSMSGSIYISIDSSVYKDEYEQYYGDENNNLYYVWEKSTNESDWMIIEDHYGDYEIDNYSLTTYEEWIDTATPGEVYYYRLVVNGVLSEPVTIRFTESEYHDEICPECGGMGGEHAPGCPLGPGGGEGGDPYDTNDPDNPDYQYNP